MAGQDELIYRIKFEVDDTSLKEIQDQVNNIQAAGATKPGTTSPIKQLEIDSKDSIQSLVELDKQIKSYRGELKVLDELRKIGVEITQDQLEKEQQMKVALKATSQEYNRQTRDLASQSAAVSTTATTYNELVARNKALSAEMRNLPLDDTTGKLEELQKEYKKNNDSLKAFDATMGNHQRNVGNYEGALKNVISELGSMQGASGEVAKGVGVIGSAFKATGPAFQAAGGGVRGFGAALKASGVGLIIPVISAFVSVLGQIQPVVDVANRIIGAFSITLKTMGDRMLGLVNATKLFAQGKFGEAADAAKQSFAGLGEEIRQNVAANDDLIVSLQKLELAENELTVARAKANKELAQAKLDSRDATKSAQERIDALQRAIQIEEEIATKEMDLAKQRFETLKAQTDLTTSSRDELAQLAQSEARVIELQTASIQRQSEAVERLNTLRKELAKSMEKPVVPVTAPQDVILEPDLGFIETIAEASQSALAAEFEFTKSMMALTTEARISELQRSGQLSEALRMQQLQRQADLEKQYLESGIEASRAAEMAKQQADSEFAQARVDVAKTEAENKVELNQMAATSMISIAKSLFGESKAFSLAEAIMNTYQGATKALASAPPPFNFAAAAAVVASGIANVKKILTTNPGSKSVSSASTGASSIPTSTATAGAIGSAARSTGVSGTEAATQTALMSFANRGMPQINVQANVDRRGLAIAVRDGEADIRSEQFSYS